MAPQVFSWIFSTHVPTAHPGRSPVARPRSARAAPSALRADRACASRAVRGLLVVDLGVRLRDPRRAAFDDHLDGEARGVLPLRDMGDRNTSHW